MIGFGRSAETRGHAPDGIKTHAADLHQCIEKARMEVGASGRLLLFGHSMGGLSVLLTLLDQPDSIDGAIVSGPAINSGRNSNAARLAAARVMALFVPNLTMNHGIEVDKINSDSEVVQAYLADPLVHQKISVRLAISIIDQGAHIRRRADKIGPECALLLLNGGDDKIASPEDTAAFGQQIGCQRSEVRILPAMKHEVWNEVDRPRFFQEVDRFFGL